MNHTDYTIEELKQMYDMHKSAYYGSDDSDLEPISDSDFDELEKYLEANDPTFEPYVGTEENYDRHTKSNHWYPMLSLTKVHCGSELSQSNINAIVKPIMDLHNSELSWKLDGFGISTKYKNGHLIQATTRGNKSEGADITAKFGKLFPQEIKITEDVELRWEALISKPVFDLKYAETFAHPRNVVVGIKNNIDLDDPRTEDVTVKCVDAVTPSGTIYMLNDLLKIGIDTVPFRMITNEEQLKSEYKRLVETRSDFIYPTDGCVLSFNVSERVHNGHHPIDSIALKFPAPTFRTKVVKVTPHLKRTGNIIPRIHFETVKVDGRNIRQCAGFNYKYIVDNGISEGAEIEIQLSGDIIPTVKSVLKASDIPVELPGTDWSGVHRTDASLDTNIHTFLHAVNQLGFDGFGTSAFKVLYSVLSKTIEIPKWHHIFDQELITLHSISEIGPNQARTLLEQIRSVHLIPLRKVISMQGVTGCGGRMSKQLALYFSNLSYDFAGLEKSVVSSFVSGENRTILENTIGILYNYGIGVENETEEKKVDNPVKYVLTGSPKSAGFKTKADFKLTLPENWIEVGNIKEADMLITDDPNSTSSKMKNAQKLGLTIKTYSEHGI